MRLNILLTFMLYFVSIIGLQAQEWTQKMQQPNVKLQEVKQSFDAHWKNRSYEKGKGYKPYKRWEYFWSQRLMPDGSLPLAGARQQAWISYLKTHPEVLERRKMRTKENLVGNWVPLGPDSTRGGNFGIGRVNCVAFHPTDINTFYAGTPSGGLWRTTDGGNSWSNLTDDLPVIGASSLVIHPINHDVMYLATGDGDAGDTYSIGVLKSTDGGVNWNTTGLNWSNFRNRRIYKLIMHPNNPDMLMVATSQGIYKTSNAASNWTRTQVGYFYDLEFKPGDPTTVYAAGTNGNLLTGKEVFRSTNTGDSWIKRSSFGGRLSRIAIAVSPANPDFLAVLAGAQNNGFGGFYTSTNGGGSFNLVYAASNKNLLGWSRDGSGSGGQAWYDITVAVSPTNADIITVGGISNWQSTDGGATWSILNYWGIAGANNGQPHADKHFLAYHPLQNNVMFEGNDGGVYRSTDGGANWTNLTQGMVHTQFYKLGVSQSDPGFILGGAQDNGTKRKNGSNGWSPVYAGDGMECFFDPTNKDIYYYSVQEGQRVFRAKPGASANITNNLPPGAARSTWVTPLTMDPGNSSNILYGSIIGLFRSTDQGDTWTKITEHHPIDTVLNGIQIGPSPHHIVVAPTHSNTIYFTTSGGLWRTNDASTWADAVGNLPVTSATNTPRVTYVIVSPTDPNTVWVTLSGYFGGQKVYKTTDGGNNWTNISGTLPNVPVNCIIHDDSSSDESLYIGTDLGVFYRNNDLGDWQPFDNGLPNVIVNELEIQKSVKKLRAATYGRGIWESDLYGDVNSSPTPIITSFTPTSGPVGTSVTIQGNNFTGIIAVKFNGVSAINFNVVSSSQITATVPNGASTGKISIITSAGSANSASDYIVTTTNGSQLSITDFTPKAGPVGIEVTIIGTNFSTTASSNTVKFNGTTATVSTATVTELKVTVPTGATTGKITVDVVGETATSVADYTVTTTAIPQLSITDFTPKAGTVGTKVTITGTNFSSTVSDNLVRFNGIAAIVSTATATELQVTVPSGATTGKITVTVGEVTSTSSEDFTVLDGSKMSFDIKPAKVITPNGDLINDTWTIEGLGRFSDHRIWVFSKAGQVVYQSEAYHNTWDGTWKGKPLAPGIYYYNIELNNRGAKERKTGYVTIIR